MAGTSPLSSAASLGIFPTASAEARGLLRDTRGRGALLRPVLTACGQRGGRSGWGREGVPGLSAAQGGAGRSCLAPPLRQVSSDDGLAREVLWARRATCCLARRSTEEVLLLGMPPVTVFCPTDPHMSRR